MLGFFLVNVQFNLIYFDNNKFVTMDRTFIKVEGKIKLNFNVGFFPCKCTV